jgi:hypothetical protein
LPSLPRCARASLPKGERLPCCLGDIWDEIGSARCL